MQSFWWLQFKCILLKENTYIRVSLIVIPIGAIINDIPYMGTSTLNSVDIVKDTTHVGQTSILLTGNKISDVHSCRECRFPWKYFLSWPNRTLNQLYITYPQFSYVMDKQSGHLFYNIGEANDKRVFHYWDSSLDMTPMYSNQVYNVVNFTAWCPWCIRDLWSKLITCCVHTASITIRNGIVELDVNILMFLCA